MNPSGQESTFHQLVDQLNQLAIDEGFAIGKLQDFRSAGVKRAFKHIFTGHSIFDRYAFHTGGSCELQFNIGLEKKDDGNDLFRYGVAFAIQQRQTLPDPIGTLAPRIQAFNQYLIDKPNALNDYLLWAALGDRIEAPRPLHEIPDKWIVKDSFIFVGQYTEKSIGDFTTDDLRGILKAMDDLMPLYKYVESNFSRYSSPIEQRVSKICWNNNGWQKPSGMMGKSKDKKSYEHQYGFGHEEWLFDFDKTIKGYHYAYLQPIGKHRDRYEGNAYDIALYSVNSDEGNRRYWIAELKNTEVISKEQEQQIIRTYRGKGWLDEMQKNLDVVNADVDDFKKWIDDCQLFNIRFRPEDVHWFGTDPVPFKDGERITHTRYTLLYRDSKPVKTRPDGLIYSGKDEKETDDERVQSRHQRVVQCSQLHNQIQNSFLTYLKGRYPGELIELETGTGYGTNIDLVRKAVDGKRTFYEVKTYPSAKSCIREAIGQLLEYAYYPDRKVADDLVIVSQAPIQQDERDYIKRLRQEFAMSVNYMQFDHEKVCVIEEVFDT